MISYALKNHKMDSIEYWTQDMSVSWDELCPPLKALEARVSLIVSNYAIHWIDDKNQLVSVMHRLLTEQGGLIVARFLTMPHLNAFLTDTQMTEYNTRGKTFSTEQHLNIWRTICEGLGLEAKLLVIRDAKWVYGRQNMIGFCAIIASHSRKVFGTSGPKLEFITGVTYDRFIRPDAHRLNPNAWTQFLDNHSIQEIDALTVEHLTIGALKRLSHSIAVALINRGVTKSDRLVYSGQNSIQHIVLRFVAIFLGLPICPLSPTFEAYEVEQEVTSMSATVVLTQQQNLPKFKRVFQSNNNNIKLVVIFNATRDTQVSEQHVTYEQLVDEGRDQTLKTIPYFPVDLNVDPFLLIHTSGSTGSPKCVILKHASILRFYSELGHAFHEEFNDSPQVVSVLNPLGHISGSQMIPSLLCLGVKQVIYSEFTVDLQFRSVERYGVTILIIYPSIGDKLIEGELCDKYDLSTLKVLLTGGGYFPAHIARAIIDKYHVSFCEKIFNIGLARAQTYIPGSLGPISPGTEVKVVDLSTGATLGPNTDGEVCVRGNKLFAGYLNNEKAYREAVDGEGWYRTGDIGHYDERENIFITD
ncbi:unnamed protein product, partial [Oppiella nova]